MNDYSAVIFNEVRDAVAAAFPTCFCTTGDVSSTDTRLPALYMSFAFPGEDEATADSSGVELWTRTTVTAEAYSGTSEHEARSIIKTVDERLRRSGFRRSNYTQVPNADPSIRRMSATWRAKVNEGGEVAAY